MSTVFTKSYACPPISESEVLRYARAKVADAETMALLGSVISECEKAFSYKICYVELDLTVTDCISDFGLFKIESKSLAKNLSGCDKAILFAGTVGIEIDRLIAKYSNLSPSRALMLQAIGTERIEALCDAFCRDIDSLYPTKTRKRFSTGYGDAPLIAQRDIIRILDAPRKIGISLNESLLMSPTKSVTAFIGIEK